MYKLCIKNIIYNFSSEVFLFVHHRLTVACVVLIEVRFQVTTHNGSIRTRTSSLEQINEPPSRAVENQYSFV